MNTKTRVESSLSPLIKSKQKHEEINNPWGKLEELKKPTILSKKK